MRHLSQSYSESQKITSNHSQESILVTNLNQIKEKAIRSNSPLDMSNDMITVALNGTKDCAPQNVTK